MRTNYNYNPPLGMSVKEHTALITEMLSILETGIESNDKQVVMEALSIVPNSIKQQAEIPSRPPIKQRRERTKPVIGNNRIRKQQGGSGNNLPKPWNK